MGMSNAQAIIKAQRNIKRLERNIREYCNKLTDLESRSDNYESMLPQDRADYERLYENLKRDSLDLEYFRQDLKRLI